MAGEEREREREREIKEGEIGFLSCFCYNIRERFCFLSNGQLKP